MAKARKTILPEDAVKLYNEIKELSKEINDISNFWEFLSNFPESTTTDVIRRVIEEYLPKEKMTIGEAYDDTYKMRKVLAAQIAETLERVKKYYPDLYFKYFKPKPHAAVVSKANLIVKLLKYGVYGSALNHVAEVVDKVSYLDEATKERLKRMITHTIYNPPPLEVKKKDWERLVYSEPFKNLMIMLSVSGTPPPPPGVPPKKELDESLSNLYKLYQQADLVLKLLGGFRRRQRADIVRETLLSYMPRKTMTVKDAREIIATKIMPQLLHKREQLMAQFVSQYPEYATYLMSFRRPAVVLKKVAPSRWRKVIAFVRYYQQIPKDKLVQMVSEAHRMSPEEVETVIKELESAGYIAEHDGVYSLVF